MNLTREDLFRDDVVVNVIRKGESNKIEFFIRDESFFGKFKRIFKSARFDYFVKEDLGYYIEEHYHEYYIHKKDKDIKVHFDVDILFQLKYSNSLEEVNLRMGNYKDLLFEKINELEEKIKEQEKTFFVHEVEVGETDDN